jgi:hypothetical protein
MATTTESPATPPPPTDASPSKIEKVEKSEKLAKVDKPDETKYKKDLSEADKQLNAITEKLVRYTEDVYNVECIAYQD